MPEYSADRRLDIIERDLRDHAKTFSSIIETITRLEGKVDGIENSRRERMVADAEHRVRDEERQKADDKRLKVIEADIASIKQIANRIIWLILSSIILAIIAFMVKGGFSP